jgi:aminotransferase EvaB
MTSLASIPFNDLGRGTQAIRGSIDAAIARVLDSGWFVLGPEHDALENELAEYLGVKHAINVANGTDALELALAALGVGSGDYIVTVANAGAYTTTAALLLGARPVYCDVDPQTLLMSTDTLSAALAICPEKPRAIVVTHLYGALAPIEAIVALAREKGIPVIEDCAQSLGARTSAGLGGSFADISTTSFYPTKNLGALGDGGAVVTNSDEHAQAIRRMRQYGWKTKYSIGFSHGKNSRLDEMQAAILRVKLPLLDTMNEQRRQIHLQYETASSERVDVVNSGDSESFIGHLAVIRVDDREKAVAHFQSHGIKTDIHYPVPDHQQQIPYFTFVAASLSVTERASDQILSVPLFPELAESEVERIVSAIGAL